MNRAEVIEYSDTLLSASYDSPFGEDFDSLVLRHTDTKRWFGLIMTVPERVFGIQSERKVDVLNLKVPPELSMLLRGNYNSVKPAYHMNKTHWISVILDGDVPNEEICKLIRLSYDLTDRRK